jgi:hypothetical protein
MKAQRSKILGQVVFLLTLVVPLSSNAQLDFEKTYGGFSNDYGYSVQQTSDGGYVIAGHTYSFGARYGDVYLIKIDSLGDTLWTRTFGDTARDRAYSVQQTLDGGYIIAGETYSFGPSWSSVYLIKTDSLGDTLWTNTIGGPQNNRAHSIQQTTDGGYIISGATGRFTSVLGDLYLVKTDSLGDTLWTRSYDRSSWDDGWSVQQTSDGGYIVAGNTRDDIFVVKTDSLGDSLWTKTYFSASWEHSYSIQQTSGGGYVIAGVTYSFGPPGANVYLIKTDPLGDTLWTKTYGGLSDDYGRSVLQTSDGGYVVAGYTNSFGADSSDVYWFKTDSLGNILWTRIYGGDHYDFGYSIQHTSDGGFIIVGETRSFSSGTGYSDVYLIKTGPNVDLSGPIPISAVASDNVNPVPGIDNDDQVMITFDEPTDKPTIDVSNIDVVLTLSGGHTWLDGFGVIGGAEWNPVGDKLLISLSTNPVGDKLLISLSTNFGPPTVAVGDVITPDGVTIHDIWGNPCVTSVIITGSFNPVGIEEIEGFGLPKVFLLSQNYPNPFYNSTLIRYAIPIPNPESKILPASPSGGHHVSLNIYDITGRLVETLVDEKQKPGIYQVEWDGARIGSVVRSGVYFYRLTAGDFTSTKKLILLR